MTTENRRRGRTGDARPTFPVKVPAELYEKFHRRAKQLFVSPTAYLQGCVQALVDTELPPLVVAPHRYRSELWEASSAARRSVNFELPPDMRDAGHAAARALGFTLTAYLVVCIQTLAAAPLPSYVTAPGKWVSARRQEAVQRDQEFARRRRAAAVNVRRAR